MKLRFNTYDIICGVTELQSLVGLRVNQIYDIDNKTYLIRFQNFDTKSVLLLESGIRFHITTFEWPKNVAPSGFTMKLRKHIKNKRLECVKQIESDRIISLQFGTGEASYYVILELYDKGNILLTDHELTILNILRVHTQNEEVRFAVKEKYPIDKAKKSAGKLSDDEIQRILNAAKPGDNLRKLFTFVLDCGPTVLEHVLLQHGLSDCVIQGEPENEDKVHKNENETETTEDGGGGVSDQKDHHKNKKRNKQQKKKEMKNQQNSRHFVIENDLEKLKEALYEVDRMETEAKTTVSKGYIVQKRELKPSENENSTEAEYFYRNIEYQPFLFAQYKDQPHKEFDTFMSAVDEFYSTLEGQKIDMKAVQQEREALKKLSNVKKDHAKRLEELNKVQEVDKKRAELITRNQQLVDNAILAIRSAIANQMSWPDINELVKAAQLNNDPVAKCIKQLKLEINHISLHLNDPYVSDDNSDDDSDGNSSDNDADKIPSMVVDVDLALSAFANARKYYDQKRSAAKKEQRTIDASQKALKSAEKKTQQTLKEVRTISTISKARKVYWFEKFYWFISSENYLIIGGRDSQQNELLVKRYMRPTDVYVHAEIQGASSVIIRNPTGGDIPPKTLLEAGTMAICYSVAWDAKVVTNAYWVKSEQVTKTAPSGEYLGAGSFMIRGKRNFLPPCHLIMGLSVFFKLEDGCVERHKGERRVRTLDDQQISEMGNLESIQEEEEEEIELPVADDGQEDEDENENVKNGTNEDIKDEEDVEEEEEEAKTSEFPDTEIRIEHDTGKVILQKNQVNNSENENSGGNQKISDHLDPVEEERSFIVPIQIPGSKKKQINAKKAKKNQKEDSKSKHQQKHQQQQKQQQDKEEEDGKEKSQKQQQQQQLKRGQRGKLKKIKIKYKDQDEEERQMRMQILKSAGADTMNKSDEKEENEDNQTTVEQNKQKQFNKSTDQQQIVDDSADDIATNADVDMIDSLTGCPYNEDELLFAIPVVAPYQALQNYKYKVKLTPGTGKRGKAAKTALLMFTKDKTCSNREKDLLKSIKDDALARNIPGKVKISAPQLQKIKKK